MKKHSKNSISGSKNGSSIASSVSPPLQNPLYNTREAVFQALYVAFSGTGFASKELETWKILASPSDVNFRFAQELTYGCLRQAIALDYMAEQLASKKNLSLKLKERILVRMGLYQCHFMSKVPAYAAINETIELSRKHCHKTFSAFLNAILRKGSLEIPTLPQGDSLSELSKRFSYPEIFIQKILNCYSLEQVKEILQSGNEPGACMCRIRSNDKFVREEHPYLQVVFEQPLIGLLKDNSYLPAITQSANFYIQNITPAFLIQELSQQWKKPPPKDILDLCASPGGKLIAVHDSFPSTKLSGNDVSDQKVKILYDNLQKYDIQANLTSFSGEFYPSQKRFDIVIVDVPCSNTGVLNKRAEARWRLTEKHLMELEILQKKLITHAAALLEPMGEIWFMTCSILPEENETFIMKMSKELGLCIQWEKTVLPSRTGWDGGYAAILSLNKMGQKIE